MSKELENNELKEAIEWATRTIDNSLHHIHIRQNEKSFRLVFEAAGRKNFNAVKMTDLCVKELFGEQGKGTLLSAAIEKLDSRELRCFVSAVCAMVWLELNPEIPRMPSDTALGPKLKIKGKGMKLRNLVTGQPIKIRTEEGEKE